MLPNDPERSLPTALSHHASRADAVLLAIPFTLLAAAALTVVLSVSLTESVAFGASAALAVTGYALFAGAPKN